MFVLDTLRLSERWDLHAGIRWDRVKARAYEQGRPDNRDLSRTDTEVSHSLGLVHKLSPRTSLYASYGSAYNISGNFDRNQVQLAGGAGARVAAAETFNASPEQMTALEIGAKWKLGTDLDRRHHDTLAILKHLTPSKLGLAYACTSSPVHKLVGANYLGRPAH